MHRRAVVIEKIGRAALGRIVRTTGKFSVFEVNAVLAEAQRHIPRLRCAGVKGVGIDMGFNIVKHCGKISPF